MSAHIDGEVRVQKHLKVKAPLSVVPDQDRRLELVPAEGHAVYDPKVVRPGFACLGAQVGGRQTKVERDAVVRRRLRGPIGLGGGLV